MRAGRAATLAAVMITLAAARAPAEILSARIAVRGMSCTICSGTVERCLRRLPFVSQATVDLDRGLAQLVPRPGQRFQGRAVLKAVRRAGFTPGDIAVVAQGRLTMRGSDPYLEIYPGELALLTGSDAIAATRAGEGVTARVLGRLADPLGDRRADVGIALERIEVIVAAQ